MKRKQLLFYWVHIKKEYCLAVMFLIFVWCIISIKFRIGLIPCFTEKCICSEVNDLLLSVGLSYIAAYIFYFLTEIRPHVENHYAVHTEMLELFRAIKDTFRDMAGEIGGGDWLENDFYRECFIRNITYDKENSSEEENKRIDTEKKSLCCKVKDIDYYLSLLINYYTYLDFETKETLAKMKTSKGFQKCRFFEKGNILLEENDARIIVNELVLYNKFICQEYENLLSVND